LLNIFLRDALYNQYLSEQYRLDRAEEFMEIPLDSISAGCLRKLAAREQLPQWRSVKGLTARDSLCYQTFASTLARDQARVHLDTFWWGQR
jgi:hypothetical protein